MVDEKIEVVDDAEVVDAPVAEEENIEVVEDAEVVDSTPIDNPDMGGINPMMAMMGGMLGGMGMPSGAPEDIPPMPEPPVEPEEEAVKVINVKTATPYNISINTRADGVKFATLNFLCRDEDDKLLTVNKNYQVTDGNEDFIELLGLTEDDDTDFVGKRIANTAMLNFLPCYISDIELTSDFEDKEDPRFTIDATDSKSKTPVKIRLTTNTGSCMKFVDSYIVEMIENEHDLLLATSAGSKVSEFSAEIFNVDSIDKISAMAGAVVDYTDAVTNPFKKLFYKIFKNKGRKVYDTSIGVVTRLTSFTNASEKESVYLLIPFDTGESYSEDKFKGDTIAGLQEKYFGDADQYVSTLIISKTHVLGVDKDYMIIRGKNKDKKLKLFMLDTDAVDTLTKMIKEY